MHWLAELRKDGENVTLAKVKGQAANIYVRRVTVIGVPGGSGCAMVS